MLSLSKFIRLRIIIFTIIISIQISLINCRCSRTCDLAFGSFTVWQGLDLTLISQYFDTTIPNIRKFNPEIPDDDTVLADTIINIPFTCDCIRNEFLGHNFNYTVVSDDTYERVASKYSNLTSTASLRGNNSFSDANIPNNGSLNVVVNCYCGDRGINEEYGLFITYPIRSGDTLQSVSRTYNLSTDVVQRYNPTANFSSVNGILFIPGRDENGSYRPITSSTGGLSGGAIAGICIGVAGALVFAGCLYIVIYRKKNVQEIGLLSMASDRSQQDKVPDSSVVAEGTSPGVTGITVDKSVEFSYEELAKATDDFNLSNKIGQGGFGAVYYAELRGERAAIKKMDMQATREFLAELKVLTHVHHLNLVRLIGYCVEGSLFLVYEYIENGNLSEHLRGTGKDPLSWSTRVQIALDSARGLEYIHEHTVPVYIHRDIKSANILIDESFHAKVADFGLTKLTEVGGSSLPTGLVGTFGYMPPESQYGDVSPKVDVYAFGVVLYELISAKDAIVKGASFTESKGLVALFEEALNQPEPDYHLRKLVDPRLGDDYPLDSVRKMAMLAKVCTHENPQLRPTMRSIVVALMTLSSSTEDWDVGSFYGNQGLVNLMSGR